MESKYNLTYVKLDKNTIDVAFDIQKSIWPENPDYNDLYDKAINPLDDNCFLLVYDKETLIGITVWMFLENIQTQMVRLVCNITTI